MNSSSTTYIIDGSFKTIPNALRQLPPKNLMIPEAHLKSICYQGIELFDFLDEFIKKAPRIISRGFKKNKPRIDPYWSIRGVLIYGVIDPDGRF
jgi:hypothetical protein